MFYVFICRILIDNWIKTAIVKRFMSLWRMTISSSGIYLLSEGVLEKGEIKNWLTMTIQSLTVCCCYQGQYITLLPLLLWSFLFRTWRSFYLTVRTQFSYYYYYYIVCVVYIHTDTCTQVPMYVNVRVEDSYMWKHGYSLLLISFSLCLCLSISVTLYL